MLFRSSQGTVAVLMKKDASGYLAMYDKTGAKLTEGEIHGAKKGYPVAIALSSDAVRLAVAMLDINDGSIKSTIAFYNFGTAGESEIDHVVGAQTFPDTVIPEIVYLADDRLAALSYLRPVFHVYFIDSATYPKRKTNVLSGFYSPNNFAYEIQKYANYETDLSYSDRDFSYAVYFLCPAHQGK